jgi:hypothetical protein
LRARYRFAFHRPELVFGASLAMAACAVAREDPPIPGAAIGEGAQGNTAGTSSAGAGGTGGGGSGTTATGGSSGSAGKSGSGGSAGSTSGAGGGSSGSSGGSAGSGGKGGSSSGSGGTSGSSSGNGGTSGESTTGGSGGSSGTGGSNAGTSSAGTSSAGTSSAGTSSGAGGTGMSGQVLFSDDFETSDAADWIPSADADAWSVVMDDTNVYRQAPPEVNSDRFSVAGDADWTDVSVEARVQVISFNGSSSSYFAGVYARVQSASNYYSFALRSDGKVSIRKTSSNLGSSVDAGIVEGEWFDVRFVVRGSTLTGYVNGTQIATVTDSSIPSGAIGVGTRNTSAMFDDVVVSVP